MTLAQVEKRLTALERRLAALQEALNYQQAIEGIRRGLEAAERGKGIPVTKAFAAVRRKHRRCRPTAGHDEI